MCYPSVKPGRSQLVRETEWCQPGERMVERYWTLHLFSETKLTYHIHSEENAPDKNLSELCSLLGSVKNI